MKRKVIRRSRRTFKNPGDEPCAASFEVEKINRAKLWTMVGMTLILFLAVVVLDGLVDDHNIRDIFSDFNIFIFLAAFFVGWFIIRWGETPYRLELYRDKAIFYSRILVGEIVCIIPKSSVHIWHITYHRKKKRTVLRFKYGIARSSAIELSPEINWTIGLQEEIKETLKELGWGDIVHDFDNPWINPFRIERKK